MNQPPKDKGPEKGPSDRGPEKGSGQSSYQGSDKGPDETREKAPDQAEGKCPAPAAAEPQTPAAAIIPALAATDTQVMPDAEYLLGGYATGTLTREEKQVLFSKALDDQDIFNALADEEALRELLADPKAKATLLAQLNDGGARPTAASPQDSPQPPGNATLLPSGNATLQAIDNVTPLATNNATPLASDIATPLASGNLTPVALGHLSPRPGLPEVRKRPLWRRPAMLGLAASLLAAVSTTALLWKHPEQLNETAARVEASASDGASAARQQSAPKTLKAEKQRLADSAAKQADGPVTIPASTSEPTPPASPLPAPRQTPRQTPSLAPSLAPPSSPAPSPLPTPPPPPAPPPATNQKAGKAQAGLAPTQTVKFPGSPAPDESLAAPKVANTALDQEGVAEKHKAERTETALASTAKSADQAQVGTLMGEHGAYAVAQGNPRATSQINTPADAQAKRQEGTSPRHDSRKAAKRSPAPWSLPSDTNTLELPTSQLAKGLQQKAGAFKPPRLNYRTEVLANGRTALWVTWHSGYLYLLQRGQTCQVIPATETRRSQDGTAITRFEYSLRPGDKLDLYLLNHTVGAPETLPATGSVDGLRQRVP